MLRDNPIGGRNQMALIGGAFTVGLLIGLVVLGWWLWPVQWVNAGPADLQDSYRRTYLSLVADSYALTGNAEEARSRLDALVTSTHTVADVGADLQAMAQERSAANDVDGAGRLEALTVVLGMPPEQVNPQPGTGELPVSPHAAQPLLIRVLRIFGLIILVLVILAGLLLLVYFLQSRTTEEAPEEQRAATAAAAASAALEPRPVTYSPPPVTPVAPTRPAPAPAPVTPGSTPLGPFVATYNLGDIDFDMSFGIESPNGDFLGECGLGMAETIGSADVQRVTAFEVWLFDKTDIRTVSLVLASAHAHADAALRTKLASRGEVVLAQPGNSFSVRTSTLRLQGRVLDLAYGGGDVPPQSYFTSLSVELTPVVTPAAQEEA